MGAPVAAEPAAGLVSQSVPVRPPRDVLRSGGTRAEARTLHGAETATPIKTIGKTIGQVTGLTCICPLKPGAAVAPAGAGRAADQSPNSPIKQINTIHFARWVIFDNDTRLLFTSNFDGSWKTTCATFGEDARRHGQDFRAPKATRRGGCADF